MYKMSYTCLLTILQSIFCIKCCKNMQSSFQYNITTQSLYSSLFCTFYTHCLTTSNQSESNLNSTYHLLLLVISRTRQTAIEHWGSTWKKRAPLWFACLPVIVSVAIYINIFKCWSWLVLCHAWGSHSTHMSTSVDKCTFLEPWEQLLSKKRI